MALHVWLVPCIIILVAISVQLSIHRIQEGHVRCLPPRTNKHAQTHVHAHALAHVCTQRTPTISDSGQYIYYSQIESTQNRSGCTMSVARCCRR